MAEPPSHRQTAIIPFVPDLPSEEYELNALIDDIAKDLSADDIKRLKGLCIQPGGRPNRALESINDGIDFVNYLRTRNLISCENIIALQCLIWRIGRKPLHDKLVDYARKLPGTVHIYAPSTKPENGYSHIKFHVMATEQYTQEKLQLLKFRIHQYLGVPIEFITTDGIQRVNSILVTLLIPAEAVDSYLNIDDNHAAVLFASGIDWIEVEGKIIRCKKDVPESMVEDAQSERSDFLTDLQNKLKETESRLEDNEMKLIKMQRVASKNVRMLKEKENVLLHTFRWLVIMTCANLSKIFSDRTPVECSKLENDIVYAKNMRRRASKKGYDMDLIQMLIEAHEKVATSSILQLVNNKIMLLNMRIKEFEIAVSNEMKSHTENALIEKIKELEDFVSVLQYERGKLLFYLKLKEETPVLSQREEYFVHVRKHRPILRHEFIVKKPGFITDEDLKLLFPILSKSFKEEDRKLLMRICMVTEVEKTEIEASKDDILYYLWSREKQTRPQGPHNISNWMNIVLRAIKREDLLPDWIELSKKATVEHPGSEESAFHKEFAASKSETSSEEKKRKDKYPGTNESHETRLDDSSGDVGKGKGRDEVSDTQEIITRLTCIEKTLENLVYNSTSQNVDQKESFSFFRQNVDKIILRQDQQYLKY